MSKTNTITYQPSENGQELILLNGRPYAVLHSPDRSLSGQWEVWRDSEHFLEITKFDTRREAEDCIVQVVRVIFDEGYFAEPHAP